MKQINAPQAPNAIGPYCHAVVVGSLMFCSGQIPLDPSTMKLVGSDIDAQTRQVFSNIKAVLSSQGRALNHVVKSTVFLKSMDDFAGMNKVYQEAFGDHKPARSAVQVAKLPMDALVEIECIVSIEA